MAVAASRVLLRLIEAYCGLLRLIAAYCGLLRMRRVAACGDQSRRAATGYQRMRNRLSAGTLRSRFERTGADAPRRGLLRLVAACCGLLRLVACCGLLRLIACCGLSRLASVGRGRMRLFASSSRGRPAYGPRRPDKRSRVTSLPRPDRRRGGCRCARWSGTAGRTSPRFACCGLLRPVAACCGLLRSVAACCGLLRFVAVLRPGARRSAGPGFWGTKNGFCFPEKHIRPSF